jgi:uncharacterized protein (TIGR02246 family)
MEDEPMAASAPVEIHALFEKAFNAGDLPGLMALYEPSASLIPEPGGQPISGTAAIHAALKRFLSLNGRVELQTTYVVQHGDVALLRSAWRLEGTGPDGKPVRMAHASAEVVRRQADGSWHYVIDHPFGSD